MKFRLPLDNDNKSVTHNIVVSVTNRLKEFFGKNNITTLFEIRDDINKNYNIDEDSNFSTKENIFNISYKELQSVIGNNFLSNLNTDYIFIDKEINLKPVYIRRKIELNLTYESKSETDVIHILRQLELMLQNNRPVLKHNIEYRYYIPNHILKLLYVIYVYKSDTLNQTFKEYIDNYLMDSVNIAFTQDGNAKELVVLEKQLDVTGTFSDISDSKVEFDKKKGTYILTIAHSIEYLKVEYIDVDYRYVINNKLLPREVLVLNKDLRPTTARYLGELQLENIVRQDSWLYARMEDIVNRGYIQIPKYDIESHIETVPDMLNVFSVLCLLKEDRKFLFSLKDLGSVKINDSVISYLTNAHQDLTRTNGAYFNITLYGDDEEMDGEIYVDEDLNVFSIDELDITKLYRCIIRVTPNIDSLNPSAKRLILKYSRGDSTFFRYSIFTDREDWFRNKGIIFSSKIAYNFNIDLKYFENDKYTFYTVLTSYIKAFTKDK